MDYFNILDEDAKAESYYLMKAQEESGSVSMLNEPEEDAWDELEGQNISKSH